MQPSFPMAFLPGRFARGWCRSTGGKVVSISNRRASS
jgi:hypothetical protein